MDVEQLQAAYDKLQKDYAIALKENGMLRERENIYRTALALTNNTITIVDIKRRALLQIYNEGLENGEWLGVADAMEDAPESIIATGIVHPDDCDAYREFYARIYAGEAETQCTIRVKGESLGWVWFTMYAKTIYGEEGQPQFAVCFSDDVTAKKVAESQYRNYRTAVTSNTDFVWEINLTTDKMIVESNKTATFVGTDSFETYSALASVAFEDIADEYRETVKALFSREGLLDAFDNARREISLEYPTKMADGSPIWLHTIAHLLTNHNGDVLAIICSYDISDRKQHEVNLRKQANQDPLVNLHNRRYFEDRVKEIISYDVDREPTLIILDIDNFKHLNDTWGHTFGDQVLRQLSQLMRQSFRTSDLLARVGGDEFVILLRSAIPDEMLRKKLSELQRMLKNFETPDGGKVDVELSIGSSICRAGTTFDELYQNADKALYEAKRHGKNRYVSFEEI